jgi:hypothetical protein
MPRGDKTKYTDKQKRKAEHIADSYEQRGVPEKEAESRAWAAVSMPAIQRQSKVIAANAMQTASGKAERSTKAVARR